MKVRRVWSCECGETKILKPLTDEDKIIIKGDGYFVTEAVSKASRVLTRCCSDKYEVLGPVVNLNIAKRLWECECGNSSAIRNSRGAILLKGEAFAFGSPTTHAKCQSCGERFRIAPDIEWASHIAHKQERRAGSKKNRRAKKRRQRNRS